MTEEEAVEPGFSARDDVAAIESLIAFGVSSGVLVVVWASGLTLVVAVLVTIVVAPFALSCLAEALSALYGRTAGRSGLSDEAFDALVEEVEQAGARSQPDPRDLDQFEVLVQQALDALPDFMRKALEENVSIVVSDQGTHHGAYGLYHGDGIAFDTAADKILIFRDTLLESFGDDPDVLREQVRITVLHELAHHLGADENQVRGLGL
jgi:predicted Zn-dependent protease with MMP-like domain